MKPLNKNRTSVFRGILGENMVLSSLMLISPVIICGDTLKNAIALICAFSAITFLSVTISSFVPRRLPFAAKVIIYAIVASIVYIPVQFAGRELFPSSIERIGIYYPLLAVNSLIIFRSEAELYAMKRGKMTVTLIFYIIGFDAVMLVAGFVREIIAYGTVNDRLVDVDIIISGLSQPFGGFIFLGLFCAVYRKIRAYAENKSMETGSVTNDSDK